MQVESVDCGWLVREIGQDVSAQGIAAAVTGLVRSGHLEPHDRLPTVREVAAGLGVSPATVSSAWGLLRRRRIIATRRRGGSTVIGLPAGPHPMRFEQVGDFGTRSRTDLTFATPDPALLPPLGPALAAGLDNDALNTYEREPITPRLRAALEPDWPFPAADWLAVNGGYAGVLQLCQTTLGPGELVAVEDPTAPRLLDILSAVEARPVAVRCDAHGPVVDSLAAAVAAGAVAFLLQPRAQSPSGHGLTAQRAAELAEVLAGTGVLVLEDDGIGDVASEPLRSIGEHLPEQTVLVRSFSKSHGPDLRIAVMAGALDPVERARSYRNFGARWTSRLLQDALAHLLTDPSSCHVVDTARQTYRQRRSACADALQAHGIDVTDRDGLSLWVPVADESHALVTLAAHGISVSPGKQFFVTSGPSHVRLAISHLTEGHEEIARVVALAASSPS